MNFRCESARCLVPTTVNTNFVFGAPGPAETCNAIVAPGSIATGCAGPTTVPAGAPESTTETSPGTNPLATSAALAASSCCPTSSGTSFSDCVAALVCPASSTATTAYA